jgi:16S rRNA processing protein RimM
LSTGDARGADGDSVVVGRIGAPRGVHGDVFVEPWTDQPRERFVPGAVLGTEPAEVGPLTVAAASDTGGKLVVRFAGIQDRDAAQALRGTRVTIRGFERPELPDPDEFYDSDLVGLTARTPTGEQLGPVIDVLHTAGADYLVLSVAGRDRLVPFVAAIVPDVDVAGGTVVVDAPEGLFDL